MKIESTGTIKVVWVEGDNTEKIFSKMFDNIDEALKFSGQKEDFIIFKLTSQKDLEEFEWELLPHGRNKLYKAALSLFFRNRSKAEKLEAGNFLDKFIF